MKLTTRDEITAFCDDLINSMAGHRMIPENMEFTFKVNVDQLKSISDGIHKEYIPPQQYVDRNNLTTIKENRTFYNINYTL